MENKILGFVNFIRRKHPLPEVNPEWVKTIARLLEEAGQPVTSQAVYNEYLSSDLGVSTTPLPALPRHDEPSILFPQPTILQLEFLTEIGSSAFHLLNTVEQRRDVLQGRTRIRRMDDEEDEKAVEAGKLPAYPRGMLKLELSDGRQSWHAMEHKKLDALRLGETPLGLKLRVHNVKSSCQLLFLSPENTEVIGGEVAALQVNQAKQFVNSLKLRMGKPIESEETSAAVPQIQNQPRATPRMPLGAQSEGPAPTPARTRPTASTATRPRVDASAAAAARRAAILGTSASAQPSQRSAFHSSAQAGPSRASATTSSRSHRAAQDASAKVEDLHSQPADWMEEDNEIEYLGSGSQKPARAGSGGRHIHHTNPSAESEEEEHFDNVNQYDATMLDDRSIDDYDFTADESFLAHVDDAETLALGSRKAKPTRSSIGARKRKVGSSDHGDPPNWHDAQDIIEISD